MQKYLLWIFLLCLCEESYCQYKKSEGFGAHQVYLWYSANPSTCFGRTTPEYTFDFVVSYPYKNITKYGLGWTGFKLQHTVDLGHEVWLSQSTSSSLSFRVHFNPLQQVSYCYISFQILILTSASSQYIQILTYGYNLQILNDSASGQGQEVFNLSSNQFTFLNTCSDIDMANILTGFVMKTAGSILNVQTTALGCFINTSVIQTTIKTNSSSNSSIQFVNGTFILISKILKQNQNYLYVKSVKTIGFLTAPTIYNSTMNIDDTYAISTQFDIKCLFGIYSFNDSVNQFQNQMLLQLQNPNSTISQVQNNGGGLTIGWRAICLIQCQIGYQFVSEICVSCPLNCRNCSTNISFCSKCLDEYFVGLNQMCQICSNAIQFCFTCNNSQVCQVCKNNLIDFYVNLQGTCSPCKHSLSNCACSNETHCLKCSDDSLMNSSNLCNCISGWYVNGVCTNILGCYSAVRLNVNLTSSKCVMCSPVAHFTMSVDGLSCSCSQYFILNSALQTCDQICGDGIAIVNDCDDGNTISGDGCSSTCHTEPNFKCTTALKSSTKCSYQKAITISLIKISKFPEENVGKFIFKLSPNILTLNKDNFLLDNLQFVCNSTQFNITNKTYSNYDGSVQIDVEYFQDMETQTAALNLLLNNQYFQGFNDSISLSFIVKSNDLPLIISYKLAAIKLLKLNWNILGYVTVFVFALSSSLGHIVGVQVIQVAQLNFLLLFYFDDLTLMFSSLKNLNFVAFIFSDQVDNSSLLSSYLQPKLDRLQIKNDFFFVMPVVTFAIIGAASIYAICGGVRLLLRKNQIILEEVEENLIEKQTREINDKNNQKYFIKKAKITDARIKKTEKLTKQLALKKSQQFIFKRCLFPLAIGFMYSSIFATEVSELTNYASLNKNIPLFVKMLAKIGSSLVICLIVQSQILIMFFPKIKNKLFSRYYKKNYPSILLLYNWLILTVFSLQLIISNQISLICLMFLNFGFLVYIICYKPYNSTIHNLSLFFYQLSTIYFSVITYKYSLQTQIIPEDIEMLLVLTLLAMLYANCIFGIARIVHLEYCQYLFRKEQLLKIVKNEDKLIENKVLQKLNPLNISSSACKEQSNQVARIDKKHDNQQQSPENMKNFEKEKSNGLNKLKEALLEQLKQKLKKDLKIRRELNFDKNFN